MALIQGYNGMEVHKENGKFVLKDGSKTVGSYPSMSALVSNNPRKATSGTTKSDTKSSSTSTTSKKS